MPRQAPPRSRWSAIFGGAAALAALPAVAGPYPPAAGKPGSDAVAATDTRITGWAVETVSLVRGPEEIDDPLSLPASYGSAASALGPADVLTHVDQPTPESPLPKPAVSLGDGGSITLRFHPPIANGPGPDFAVFENGISFNGGSSFFMELAFVEASSDGVTFARFPAVSDTPASPQIGSFAAIDPTNLHNLAGKYLAGYGTPFDLAELAGAPGLNLAAITHLRVIDVVGSVQAAYARLDSRGRVINDPWPTFLTTSGFDLDAIGVMNQARSGFAAWRDQFSWPAGGADPDADPDADGVPNLLEYAFALPPLTPQPPPALTVTATDTGWIATRPTLRQPADDLAVTFETSADLRQWSPAPDADSFRLGPLDGPPAFCRFRVTLLSPP